MTEARHNPEAGPTARARVADLVAATETLAALAACLADRTGQAVLPDELAGAVTSVAATVADVDGLSPEDAAQIAGVARAMLTQAAAFATDPGGAPPSWSVTDPDLLTSLGQASAAFAPLIRDQLAPQLAGLADSLAGEARILDVGMGVGALSIAFARAIPTASVVGIDIWEPSLAISRDNVAAAGLGDRIEVREQDVTTLAETEAYDLVWFSGPFIPKAVLGDALARCRQALRDGGWLIFGAYGGADQRQRALADLRTVRSGGAPLGDDETLALLAAAGLRESRVLEVAIGMPARLIAARR
jgi:predicted O-methyltransferase YrrM